MGLIGLGCLGLGALKYEGFIAEQKSELIRDGAQGLALNPKPRIWGLELKALT